MSVISDEATKSLPEQCLSMKSTKSFATNGYSTYLVPFFGCFGEQVVKRLCLH